MKHFKLKK